jgi:hypothetical protein
MRKLQGFSSGSQEVLDINRRKVKPEASMASFGYRKQQMDWNAQNFVLIFLCMMYL